MQHAKRLIEVDLPIMQISQHARHEQNLRKGHLHSFYIWWATRPLASCRSAILGAILPDPVDKNCSEEFRSTASNALSWLSDRDLSDPLVLREALLQFIADFSSWQFSNNTRWVDTARVLVKASSHEPEPLALDPFSGMGSLPFEALRLGVDAIAMDLNPNPVLMNKVALGYLPQYKERLVQAIKRWGHWVVSESRRRLKEFYPTDDHGGSPWAYFWARTIQCEGPGCGAEVPLLGMTMLSNKKGQKVHLHYEVDDASKKVIVSPRSLTAESEVQPSISRRFSVTCPVCHYTTPYKRVRAQIVDKSGGTRDARHLATGTMTKGNRRGYRSPNGHDSVAFKKAKAQLLHLVSESDAQRLSAVPDELFPSWYSGVLNPGLWGVKTYGDLFTERQLLALITYGRIVREAYDHVCNEEGDKDFARAVATCLALSVSKMAVYNTATCYLHPDFGLKTAFLGSGMPMVGDFAEINPTIPTYVGGYEYFVTQLVEFLERELESIGRSATVQQGSATCLPLPDDSVSYIFTDPPYYAAVPYSHLSDFTYVWLRRILHDVHPELLKEQLTPKDNELIAYYVQPHEGVKKDDRFFENGMQQALSEARRVLKPDGIAVIIFAHKGTAGWEAMLNALLNAGWIVTSSWPIDTENRQRWRAAKAATLSSSVHLVCRPRGSAEGVMVDAHVGDWRDVLNELPTRIREWMPRLAKEGVIGADAIFACLGPALEIFSRYSSVEKSNGDKVQLKEYLEHVWAAVAREALNMVFEGADTSGFEEDARLTAMWLWTLRTSITNGNGTRETPEDEEETKTRVVSGYSLEYDAARKIAQGLGAHLERLDHLVEIKGEVATLLSAAARTRYLFGRDVGETPRPRSKRTPQLAFDFAQELEKAAKEAGLRPGDSFTKPGVTVLDQLHQSMILFGAGRGETVKRLLVDEGVGQNPLFWRLAQSLSALYPPFSEEKRWVDGVLGRKKGLGL